MENTNLDAIYGTIEQLRGIVNRYGSVEKQKNGPTLFRVPGKETYELQTSTRFAERVISHEDYAVIAAAAIALGHNLASDSDAKEIQALMREIDARYRAYRDALSTKATEDMLHACFNLLTGIQVKYAGYDPQNGVSTYHVRNGNERTSYKARVRPEKLNRAHPETQELLYMLAAVFRDYDSNKALSRLKEVVPTLDEIMRVYTTYLDHLAEFSLVQAPKVLTLQVRNVRDKLK